MATCVTAPAGFAGRTALVTGSSAGIGLALARGLALADATEVLGRDPGVTIEPDPRGGHPRPSVLIERDHMRDRIALQECAGRAGYPDPGHGPMLPIGRVGPCVPPPVPAAFNYD